MEIESLKATMRAMQDRLDKLESQRGVAHLESRVDELSRGIRRVSKRLEEQDAMKDGGHPPQAGIMGVGVCERQNVIAWLRGMEKMFDRLVVVRMIAGHPYGILDPSTDDGYGSSNKAGAWIDIKFNVPLIVNGVQITSGPVGFPRTFDVVLTDAEGNVTPVSFNDEAGLNGENLPCKRTFSDVCVKSVQLLQKGPNWSEKNHFNILAFELFSPVDRYKDGVFRSLLTNNLADIRKIVEVSARDFDGSYMHVPNTKKCICTLGTRDHPWVEVELVRGRLAPTCYRIQKHKDALKSWTLRGSNDRSLALDEWEILHRHCEEVQTNSTMQFELLNSVTPFKYFRLVQEAPDWRGESKLRMCYLDFDGIFYPD